MSKIVKKSVLLKTSSEIDVKRGGGKVAITGLQEFSLRELVSAKQIYYRAEVVQVATAGAGLYTPAGGTKYRIKLINPAFGKDGVILEVAKVYSYVTPTDITTLGNSPALQREAIHVALIALINADAKNYVEAATSTGGAGFTITDDVGYYPGRINGATNGRQGAPIVLAVTNADGSGFATSSCTITTAAVYGWGVGTRMVSDIPVYANMTGGNLISGEYDAPVDPSGNPPVAGQQYDAFAFQVVKNDEIPTMSNIFGFKLSEQVIWVDNGKGKATTNAAGFKLFERKAQKVIFELYKNDRNATMEWFDTSIIVQGPIGTAPVGTTATNNSIAIYNDFISSYGALELRNVGTQTILGPTRSTDGLLTDQDINTGDGSHYSPSLVTVNDQNFVVGKESFSVVANWSVTAVTGANFQVGFHEKLYFTDFNDYVTLASVGTLSTAGEVTTRGILANAATVITSSATVTVNAVTSEFRVHVAIDGTVSCYVDNVKYPIYSAGTTALVLAAGTVVTPFFQNTCITGTASVGVISKFVAVADAYWKL